MSIPFLRAYIRYEPRLAISSTFGICYSLSIGLVLILSTAKCYRCLTGRWNLTHQGSVIDGLLDEKKTETRQKAAKFSADGTVTKIIDRISGCLVSHTLAGPA